MKRLAIPALLLLTTSGCASIVNGTNQPLSVETRMKGASVAGANCKLLNDKGAWFVTTPGSVTVHRSYEDLKVQCEKDGIQPGISSVKSSTKAWPTAISCSVASLALALIWRMVRRMTILH